MPGHGGIGNRPNRTYDWTTRSSIGLVFPKVVGSIPTVAGHIFQARPVWIYTQSNITNIIFTWERLSSEYTTPTQKKSWLLLLDYIVLDIVIGIEGTRLYHILATAIHKYLIAYMQFVYSVESIFCITRITCAYQNVSWNCCKKLLEVEPQIKLKMKLTSWHK